MFITLLSSFCESVVTPLKKASFALQDSLPVFYCLSNEV